MAVVNQPSGEEPSDQKPACSIPDPPLPADPPCRAWGEEVELNYLEGGNSLLDNTGLKDLCLSSPLKIEGMEDRSFITAPVRQPQDAAKDLHRFVSNQVVLE